MNFTPLYSSEPLAQNEMSSIAALIKYLEYQRGFHAESTSCKLAAEFRVTDVKEIKRRDYDRAVRFLIDLEEPKIN